MNDVPREGRSADTKGGLLGLYRDMLLLRRFEEELYKFVEAKQKVWLASYVVLLFVFAAFFYLLRLGYLDFAGQFTPLLQRLSAGGMAKI